MTKQSSEKKLSMFEFFGGKTRVGASRSFYELLVLQSHGKVKLRQTDPFADIDIYDSTD